MNKTEKQLNILLKNLNTRFKDFTEDQNSEYAKIAFFYSCDRMSALEVALRMYFIYTNRVDEIYTDEFKSFVGGIEQ